MTSNNCLYEGVYEDGIQLTQTILSVGSQTIQRGSIHETNGIANIYEIEDDCMDKKNVSLLSQEPKTAA
jgi:hypothetical protein